MLIKYKESQEAPLINPGTKKRLHSEQDESRASIRDSKSFLWSDVVDDIEMSQLDTQIKDTNSYLTTTTISHATPTTTDSFHVPTTFETYHGIPADSSHTTNNNLNLDISTVDTNQTTTTNPIHTTTPSTDLYSKLDNLTTIILSMKTDSDSKLDFLLSSLDKLMTKNQDLEQKLANLSARLQITEDKLKTSSLLNSSNATIPIIPPHSSNTIRSTSATLGNNSNSHSLTTWASIAKAPLEHQSNLAQIKARENITTNRRSALVAQLSKVAKTRTTLTSATSSVYVAGFEYIKLREIWKAFYTARFQVSRIINIQWIGKTVLDIVVSADYHLQFVSELALNNKFRILTFNPSCNLKAPSSEQNETAMRAFAVRCIKNITNVSNSTTCINHFKNISQEYCNKNPDLSKIFAEEWNRAKPTILLKTQDIIAKLTDASNRQKHEFNATVAKDMQTDIESLRKLSPNHPYLLSVSNLMTAVTLSSNDLPETCVTLTQTTTNPTNLTNDIEMEDTPTESSTTTADSTKEDGSGAY